MADMFGDIASGIMNTAGSAELTITGVIAMLFIPVAILWCAITFYGLYLIFIRRFEWVSPFAWGWKILVVKPYADFSTNVRSDLGALCERYGLTRLKIQTENFVMHRMDTKDIYRGYEIVVVSLGPSKKFYGKKTIDVANKKIIINVENVDVARMHYVDNLVENDPKFLDSRIGVLSTLFMYWTVMTLLFSIDLIIVIYPLFVRYFG